jgi:hypothetical protein
MATHARLAWFPPLACELWLGSAIPQMKKDEVGTRSNKRVQRSRDSKRPMSAKRHAAR